MLDEQADQIFSTTDAIAERARKVGGTTLGSIGQIHRIQRLLDNDADYVTVPDMLFELADDHRRLDRGSCGPRTMSAKLTTMSPSTRLDRSLDRRSRTAQLVPLRGHPLTLNRRGPR